MYDVQTILSAYDKQGTLVQWLKNLDEILKSSGLETIEKIEVENGVKLVFKFAGGTTIESPVINKINTLDIEADSVKIALTDANGVLVEYYSTLTVNGENVESNIKILFPIKGSESVIVDVAENGTAIEIHLDADILNDINRALKTPLANPSATELVAVDTNGAQTMLEIGQGLKVEAGILEAEATGGGGNYVLELTGESGTLTDEQYQAVVDNFPNVTLLYNGALVTSTMVKIGDEYGFYVTVSLPIGLTTTIIAISTNKTWTMQQSVIPPSTGSGLQIKQITFTDRPSLYSWLNGKTGNILKFAFSSVNGSSFSSSVHQDTYNNETVFEISDMTSASGGPSQNMIFANYYTIFNDRLELGRGTIILNNSNELSGTYYETQTIPDEYWTQVSATVTITYIE